MQAWGKKGAYCLSKQSAILQCQCGEEGQAYLPLVPQVLWYFCIKLNPFPSLSVPCYFVLFCSVVGFFLFLFFSVSERKKIKGSAGLVAIHNFSLHSNSSKGIEHLGFHLFSCFPSIENVLGWLWPCQLDRRNITDSTFLNKVW